MSLDGAKLLFIGEDGEEDERYVLAKGKTFKFGYYMDCDVVLEHPDALGVQCTIDCDGFGRVTIANLCQDQVISLNGKPLKKLRPLLHNTEICIFDKKFLWLFEKDENLVDYVTPKKQTKKAEQPPNSEPGFRWRTRDKRLTIHTFSYSIESGKELQTAYTNTDRNRSPITCERIESNSLEPNLINRESPTPSTMDDLIDLETPKPKQMSFAGQRTPLLCCSFSETVITSYSPRDNTFRAQAKSYAIVQSTSGTPKKQGTQLNVTLGPFKKASSPIVVNHRPSMHLIDLTTPMKRSAPLSPLNSTHKKNKVEQFRLSRKKEDTSAESTASTVFSVHSTDDESVIELSDDGSFSPSPVIRTPSRQRTPQSLMKRAILSSAKKAIAKPVQPPAAPPPITPSTPKSPTTAKVRFQSQSTPHRRSLAAMECVSADRTKASKSVLGKSKQPMVTSTPFRSKHTGISNRRSSLSLVQVNNSSSILRSPSTPLVQGINKSRTSLMLRQALTASPTQKNKDKSILVKESWGTPSKDNKKSRKSVSFLEQSNDVASELNRTFSVEEIEDFTNEVEIVLDSVTASRKDTTFSPEKKSNENKTDDCIMVPLDDTTDEKVAKKERKESTTESISDSCIVAETPVRKYTRGHSSFQPLPGITSTSKRKSTTENVSSTILDSPRKNKDSLVGIDILPDSHNKNSLLSVPQTPQSSKSRLRKTPLSLKPSSAKNLRNIIDEEDFEGLDAVFKTPKARNIMILSSPKSVALQKPSVDSVELINSTEFDMSTNLDALFKTPQSELVVNRTETTIDALGDGDEACKSVLSPEEAFDKLVGRMTVEKCYVRKVTTKQRHSLPLETPRDPDLPKTDIEEWIEKVNDSIDRTDEDEISYLNTHQSEVTRDPLMMSAFPEEVATSKKQTTNDTLNDEIAMTIRKVQQANHTINESVSKDPLEVTIAQRTKQSVSPNISGIDLLDHTSESAFSETLAISDDSSEKENFEHAISTDAVFRNEAPEAEKHVNISPTKAKNEIEKAFENFERERTFFEEKRLVSTPEHKKLDINTQNSNRRKTIGTFKSLDTSFDLNTEKCKWEQEVNFKNFVVEPVLTKIRCAVTPDDKTLFEKYHTTKFISERELDLMASKVQREMNSAFKNFEENPSPKTVRTAKTPDPKKPSLKDHRRTMGTKLISKKELNLEAAKAEREKELAFKNFEEEPVPTTVRTVKTPDPKKPSLKDHRRTMGTKFVPEKELDFEAAKAEREMELAFENFEEEPVPTTVRIAMTPDPKKSCMKDHRRTMGTKFVPEKELDLEAAKAERETELAFANFEEEPVPITVRTAKTPDPKKPFLKDHRRTMGTKFVPKKELDLEAAKAEREMELAFENFEKEPVPTTVRAAKTPEPKKPALKDHRRTMGTKFVPKKELDLEAAKTEREMELAFENFEEDPVPTTVRAAKTPEPKKPSLKDHRRTMGTKFVPKKELDLEAAKAEREMELAFENFEEDPVPTTVRITMTPDPKKSCMKDHRRTMGTKFVPKKELDLEAAKAEREMELAFENFEKEPVPTTVRAAKTPEPKKPALKDHRRTMGTKFVPKKELDLEAAKTEREMELAFENFEEDPVPTTVRAAKTPEPKKPSLKDHRRTMGTKFVPEKELDLEAAKAEREMELAFANFEEEPVPITVRTAKTPDPKKPFLKDHRRTMGTKFVPKKELDLEAAKAEREMELAFENFEKEPVPTTVRAAKTPEPKKPALKDHRRTMGTKFVPKKQLDLEAAKTEREMELAFENFEEEPVPTTVRAAKTPEPKKPSLKDHRRTMGTKFVPKKELNLEAAKAEREMELAFENFEEDPVPTTVRIAMTPDPKKSCMKDYRRTMGTKFVPKKELDLEAAKTEREMELAFENFEEDPVPTTVRAAKTPEPKKPSLKDHRRTMGTKFVPKKELDLEAAKAEREMELAFKTLMEESVSTTVRTNNTPISKESPKKDDRRARAIKLVPEKEFCSKIDETDNEVELKHQSKFIKVMTTINKIVYDLELKPENESVDLPPIAPTRSEMETVEDIIQHEEAYEIVPLSPLHSNQREHNTINVKIPKAKTITKTVINAGDKAQISENTFALEIKSPRSCENIGGSSEEADEIVPSTPLHSTRRGRKVMKVKKFNIETNGNKTDNNQENKVHIAETSQSTATHEMNSAHIRENAGLTERTDDLVPSTSNSKQRGRKGTNAQKLEEKTNVKIENVTGDTGQKQETSVNTQVLSSVEYSGDSAPQLMQSGRKINEKNTDDEAMVKIENNADCTIIDDINSAGGVKGSRKCISDTTESYFIETGTEGIKVEVGEMEEDNSNSKTPRLVSAKSRSRRITSTDEHQKTEPAYTSKSVRSQKVIPVNEQEDVKIETPIPKRARGRAAKNADLVAIVGGEVKTEESKEHFVSDSVVTSTPGLRRGRRGVVKDISVPKEASTSISDHKNLRRRQLDQDLDNHTEKEEMEKRSRLSDTQSALKESQVNILPAEDLDVSNLKEKTSRVNKKRDRTETIKSELSESKTKSPLRKRGRRQDNNNEDPIKFSLTSDQPVEEEEHRKDILLGKQVPERKQGSDLLPERKPIRSRRVPVKNNALLETVIARTVEEVDEKHTVSDDTSGRKPSKSRRIAVKDNPLQEVIEEACDKLSASDTESENSKSQQSLQQKSTRLQRAAVKENALREVSQAIEQVRLTADIESEKTKSEESSQQSPTSSQRAQVRQMSFEKVVQTTEDILPTVDTESKNIKSEDISKIKSNRSRRAEVKDNSPQEMSQALDEVCDKAVTIDIEPQNTKPEGTTQKKPTRSRRAAVKQNLSQDVSHKVGQVSDKLSEVDIQLQSKKSEKLSEKKPTRLGRAAVTDVAKLAMEEHSDENKLLESTQETSADVTEDKSTRSAHVDAEISQVPSSDNMVNAVEEDIKSENNILKKKSTRGRKALAKNNTSIGVAPHTTDAEKSEFEEDFVKRPKRARRNPVKSNISVEVVPSYTEEEHQKSKSTTTSTVRGNGDTTSSALQHSTPVEVNDNQESENQIKLTRNRRGAELHAAEEKRTSKTRSRKPAVPTDTEDEEQQIPKPTRGKKVAQLKAETPSSKSIAEEKELPKGRVAELQESEEKHTPKTRGRKPAAQPEKEGDSVEKQTPKPTRGKKVVQTKTETPATNNSKSIAEEKQLPKGRVAELQESEEKHTPKTRGRKPAAQPEKEGDSVETPKPILGKKTVQLKTDTSVANNSKSISEEKELPKRTMRTRKTAAKHEPSESEDDQHQIDSKKNTSRRRKAPEPATEEEESKVLKRGNRQMQEVLTDESTNTPKRSRRKLRT